MSNPIPLPNWMDHFRDILLKGSRALEWGLPEPWFHAELSASLANKAEATGWTPLSTEIPYVTLYPVVPGRGVNAGHDGVVKWCDLCLHSKDHDSWCWIELKVRHAGKDASLEEKLKAAKQARDVFRKDVVALWGFLPEKTGERWSDPDPSLFYFSKTLQELKEKVGPAKHHFLASIIQLDAAFEGDLWAEAALARELVNWLSHRRRGVSDQRPVTEIERLKPARDTINGHGILSYQWSL